MKRLNEFLLLSALALFCSCTYQLRDNAHQVDPKTVDLTGKWNQVSTNKSLKEKYPKIAHLNFVNDTLVDIHVVDSSGQRKISGKWEYGFTKKIGRTNIELKSDIKIIYFLNDHHIHLLGLNIRVEDGKTVMTSHGCRFEKE